MNVRSLALLASFPLFHAHIVSPASVPPSSISQVAGEASSRGDEVWIPPADAEDPYWIRYENRTFMNKGQGPMDQMMNDLDNLVSSGDASWKSWFGEDKSKWIFNTACCATVTNYKMAKC